MFLHRMPPPSWENSMIFLIVQDLSKLHATLHQRRSLLPSHSKRVPQSDIFLGTVLSHETSDAACPENPIEPAFTGICLLGPAAECPCGKAELLRGSLCLPICRKHQRPRHIVPMLRVLTTQETAVSGDTKTRSTPRPATFPRAEHQQTDAQNMQPRSKWPAHPCSIMADGMQQHVVQAWALDVYGCGASLALQVW